MLSMEGFLGTRALGEESLQMWDLNKRLEAYLARVKFLEEENEVLRAEIQSAKGSPGEDSWRTKYEEELRALRATLDDAFREKCSVEMARDNLYEEIQYVKSRCQKEQAAREEAKKQLSMSKKELEEERRAQIWLKERALQLEKEVEALLEVHEEEKAGLDHEIASFSQSLESFRCVPVAFQPVEVEDYSKRLSEIWKGAVETYKTEVSQLESSLCQAKENLWKAVEDNQQSQLQLQHLEKDLAGLKARKDMLEESLSRQWQEQRGEAEKFQLALEALEQEKQALRVQIAQVLEDRQQLMHLKMSLSLEVATYRTLLEAESTRLQMPAGEYKLANGLRDVKLEMSSSKLQPSTPESRRLLSWDHRMSPSIFPKAEAKMQLAKTQSDSLKALTPKSKSPVTREFQKINSVLQSPVLKAAGAARDHGAAGRSVPSPVPPNTELPAASMEAAAGPSSQEQPKSLSPTVPLGPEPSKENKQLHEETTDETQDLSEEPPGKSPTPQLLYPDQLVTEALQDALKEVRDDAQPKEEPILRAERATEGYSVGNVPELPGWTAADHPTEEVNTAEVASFETLLEERAGEDMHEQPDMESTAQWDGATSHQELGPSSKQEEESTPDFLVAAQSEIETQEEMRSLEEEGSKEEEMPTLLSPGESREPEFVHNTAESLLGKDTLASSQTDDEHWEGSSGHPSQAAAMGGGLEEPEQGEDDVEAVSTEALHLSEDEERREPWSPSREEEGCDFPGEMKEVQEEESLQREIQATHACPMESHPVLPGESHLEEDLVERKQESLGQQEMPLCETDPATEEERREEICPEHEPSNIKESISAEEASSKDEDDTMGEEIADRARDSKGEMGEPREEALEGEDLRTEGKPLGHDDLRQEEVILDAPGDLQENGFEDDILEEEDLETLPREEVLGSGDDDNYQKHCPEDWEMKGEEDIEESPGTEDANITSQEPAWAGDILTSTAVPETEEIEGISPAEIEEMGKDDEDTAGSNLMSHQEQMLHETEQEAEPALGLVREVQEGHEDQSAQVPRDEELVTAPEASWEVETRAEDELASEPDELEKASTISAAFQQAPGDYAESDESQEEVAQRAEELGQEPGTAKTIQLEDTLPDSTPLHLYEGEMLAAMAASPNPLATEDATEPALGSEIALEEEGELEGSHTPTTPLEESHEEEEAGMEPAPAAEHAEEEEGYFMVSAPNQEAPSSEEAEISEDFEEIKVEAADASKDDLKAPRETSPAPGDEEHFEAFVGEADEGIQMPTEECEMPKAEDFTAEEDEAVPTAEPSSPLGEGRFAGITDEPERGAESPDTDSRAREGQGPSEGFAAEPDEEVGSAIEPEHDKSGGAEFPSHDCPGQLGEEETLPGQEDESGAAELTPPGGLQVQMDPVSPPPGEATPEESALVMQPSLAPEDETLDGDSLSLPEAVQTSDDDPPPPGSLQEASDQGGSDPGHDGFAGTTQDNTDGLDLPAKMPVDVMKDSDILEIVEQALEFNQELMLGARLAEAEQQAPGATEPTRPPHELGEDDGDSSPVSSSEEEPTVHETTAATASSTKEPATSGVIRAEHQELNGLHSEASLEDLVEFPEELPNGIAGAQPATRQDGRVEQEQFGKVPIAQELPGEEAEPAATSAVVPPPAEELGYGEAPAGINPTQGVPLLGKHVGAESASAASALGDELLRLAPSQPPRCQLKDEQESWSSEDE